jgi:hypothetical protein
MKVGDRVIMKSYGAHVDETIYIVLEVDRESVKLKHPTVGGYFVFSKEKIESVVDSLSDEQLERVAGGMSEQTFGQWRAEVLNESR